MQISSLTILAIALSFGQFAKAELPYAPNWKRYPEGNGVLNFPISIAVSTDAFGNVYVAGNNLNGSLSGDVFLSKYDLLGNQLWTRMFGSSNDDRVQSISSDADGNSYLTGLTYGDLERENSGNSDAWIRKYDQLGNEVWTTQFGTASYDRINSVSSTELENAVTQVHIAGYSQGFLSDPPSSTGAFLGQVDPNSGEILWTKQIGAGDLYAAIVADRSGNLYTAGHYAARTSTVGVYDYDATLRKFDSTGSAAWYRRIDSDEQNGRGPDEEFVSVATDDAGSVFVSGFTYGSLESMSSGERDAIVMKYSSDGKLQWTRQFGTSGSDIARSVAIDGLGNLYVVGNFANVPFLRKYDTAGILLWSIELTAVGLESGNSVTSNSLDTVFIAGESISQNHAWIQSFSPVVAGDFDLDGDVDGRDFLAWQRNPSVGDLADWQANYGTQLLSASTAVPEPGGMTLLVGLAILGFFRPAAPRG